MASRPLDGLLPIRQILVDGEATPFLRDLDFSSASFDLTVDEAAGKLSIAIASDFAVDQLQGAAILIGTEVSNATIDIGNGADTITLSANDITLGADNVLSLAAPAVRLGGAAASDRLTVSGATGIITIDAADNTITNLRADTFGIYEAAQASPSFIFSSDADAASSLTFGSGTTVTINQTQSISGAGRALTVRGQQGVAGQVGGALILAGGLGGTSGTNAAGAVRIKLGPPVSGATAPFYLEREDGTPVMTTYEIAAGIVGHYFGSAGGSHQGIVRGATLGLESSTGLVAIQPATDLYIGHASNRDIFHRESGTTVLTEHLDADGETRLRFASGPTAIKIDHSQHASGAGAPMTVRAQQGASGQVGGNLELGSGLGGTAGTNAPGNIKLRVGAQAGGQTGHVLLTDESSGDTDFLRMRRVGTATYLESIAGDLNLSATAAAQVIATTTMVFRGTGCYFDANTLYTRTNGLALKETVTVADTFDRNYASGVYPQWSINGAMRMRYNASGFYVASPNSFNSFEVQDAGISLSHANGYVDITGGGSPGVTLNTTDSTAAISSANSALLRRSTGGRVYRREFVYTVQTTNATPVYLTYTTTSNTGYRVRLDVQASNDTDNEFASYATKEGAWKNVSGTLTNVGGVDKIGSDYSDASLVTATSALNTSGATIRAELTGIAGKTINWNVIMTFLERVIT